MGCNNGFNSFNNEWIWFIIIIIFLCFFSSGWNNNGCGCNDNCGC